MKLHLLPEICSFNTWVKLEQEHSLLHTDTYKYMELVPSGVHIDLSDVLGIYTRYSIDILSLLA